MEERMQHLGTRIRAFLVISNLLLAAAAQSAVTQDSAHPKPLAFEVVSIRQNISGVKAQTFGPTPDGFRMINASLSHLILTAYVPQTGAALFWEPLGFPSWLSTEQYDIEAKVSEADLPEWQKPSSQPAMLRAMLQSLLADRLHLEIHREMKPADVYYLVLGKNGPKFQQSKPDDPRITGRESRFPGGGIVVPQGNEIHFYQAPMTLLAFYLTNRNLGSRPVQDRTALPGRYDFVLQWGAATSSLSSGDGPSDPGPSLFTTIEALGLKLVPAKGQKETLILDHIDHPTEN
jgi:uncharacterized protein (TIGR03435 family)